MNRSAYIYVWTLAASASAVLGVFVHLFGLPSGNSSGLVAFCTLAIISEALSLDFVVGPNRRVQSSIIFIPLFSCALAFDPASVVLVAGVSVAVTQVLQRVSRPSLLVFNISQYIVAFGLAALTYRLLGGPTLKPGSVSYPAFAGMALTFFLTNLLLVAGLLSLRGSVTFLGTLRTAIGPGGGNLLYDILSSPIAIVAYLLYTHFLALGLFLLALPLLLVRYSYSSKLQLERVNKDLLRVLVKAIETRDPYTSGHSIRVSGISRMIGDDIGLGRRDLDDLETAALLHDIGKIEALYASVISKPHDLSAEEKALIRSHSSQGADILLTLSAFRESTVKAVRHHHERFDGSGYPDGLEGTAIPLAARIIMIADAVDAMLSDRPYRMALAPRVVEAELRENAGSQFDPGLVELIFRKGTLRRIVEQREVTSSSVRLIAVAP